MFDKARSQIARVLAFLVAVAIEVCLADASMAGNTPSIAFGGMVKDGAVIVSYDQLSALPQEKLTEKIQANGTSSVFEGPYLGDVLAMIAAKGSKLHVSALDDYATDVPMEMVTKYHAILAIHRDGKPISVDNLGPFLIMFPYAENPEINNDVGWSWAVWQLNKIVVQ